MKRYSRKKNSVKIFGAVTTLVALLLVSSYYFASRNDKGKVVAKVNGQEIFESELTQKLRNIFDGQSGDMKVPTIENLPKEVLDILIKEVYLDKELSKLAKKSSVSGDKEVVVKIAEAQNKILREAYVKMTVAKQVSDQKVSDKYAEISSGLAGKKEYHMFHIVVKTKDDALKVRREIGAKKDFASLAKKYSIDQESAERGGDLGFILEDNVIKEIAEATANLKDGEVSEPVKTKFGWHLIKFTEIRDAQPLSFDSVKENIREQLEQDAVNEIESSIVKDAKVEILISPKEAPAAAKEEVKSKEESSQDNSSEQKAEEEQIDLEQQNEQSDQQKEEQKVEKKDEKPADEKSKEKKSEHKKHRK